MFSQTMEYALRAVLCLGMTPGEARTTKEVAEQMKIPPSYLAKIMRNLVKAGVIESQRGIHGGFKLSADPNTLPLLTVVNAVDPILRVRSCPLQLAEHCDGLCALHSRLDDVLRRTEEAFAGTTLSQVLDEHS